MTYLEKQMTNKNFNKQYKYFNFLSLLYCTLLIFSVLMPHKIISVFGYTQPGGILSFPATYLLAGVIAEVYGRKESLKLIYISVFNLFIFNSLIFIVIRLPYDGSIQNQEAIMQVFGSSMQLFFGCFFGLLCSDLTNVYRITRLKFFFKGKYFAQRLLWSTAISEAIFNIVTYQITYFGVLDYDSIWKLILNSWILKMAYSLLMIIPLLFLMKFLKKSEGVDIYDINTLKNKIPSEILFFNLLKSSKEIEKSK